MAPASSPKKHASSSSQFTKPNAGESITCTRIRPTLAVQQPSGLKDDKLKVPCAGVLRNGEIKTEASERVQASIPPPIRPPAANHHQDPYYAPQDAVRGALAAARQATSRKQNVYARQREEARRELDRVVQTVFFDDPYILPEDVLKP